MDAVAARHGPVIQHRIVDLRSLFRAVRQERLIFRDPARDISLPGSGRPPQPLPADRVAGLLDRAAGPLAGVLVAIHALTAAGLVRQQAADLDLASCTLTPGEGTSAGSSTSMRSPLPWPANGSATGIRPPQSASAAAPRQEHPRDRRTAGQPDPT
jgi:hypothetical protein